MILIIDALLLHYREHKLISTSGPPYHFKFEEDKVPTVPPSYLLMQMPLACNRVNKKQHYTAKKKIIERKIANNQALRKMKQL